MKTFIVTVGTSLLTNKGRPWEGRDRDNSLPNSAEATHWLRGADPVTASAETNTLNKVGLETGDAIAFLHTATDEGRWCAEVLTKYYEGRGFRTQAHEISGLNYKTGDVTDRGLRALVHLMFDLHRKAQKVGSGTIFCATGGFKAETAYMYLAATLLGCRVCYVHELYKELVWLPALPVKLDMSLVRDNEDFFAKLQDDVTRADEINHGGWLQGTPQLRFLVDEADGLMQLNAAGMLLWELYRGAAGEVSGQAGSSNKNRLSKSEMHHWQPHSTKLLSLDDCDFVERYEYPHENVPTSPKKGLVRSDYEKKAVFVRAMHGDNSVPLKVITIEMPADLFKLAARHIGEIFES
ncbi:MAG: putative CRISPR-associated protein [Fimbriimonadia bacterium]|jgi:putative CRISPR-associated protein (TIGR02619 family)